KEYGVAINPLTTNVLVLTRQNPTNMLVVLDPLTGAEKHYIDWSGLLPISSGYNKVDVADDGIIYLCNLSTDTGSNPFRIDGLSDDGPVPALAGRQLYYGDPGYPVTSPNVVWGGTMAVRGSGADTEILLGSGSWNQSSRTVAILRNSTGFFVSTPITVPDAPDKFARLGLDWGPGTNTFWAKSASTTLILVEFDINTGTGFVKKTYPLTGARSVPSSVTGIKYDRTYGLLAGLQNGSPPTPVSVPVYDVRDLDAGPFWVDQELFTSYNADIEFQGNVDFAAGYLVALGVNNGLKAFKVNPNFTASLPVIVSHPVSAAWFAGSNPSFTVVADSTTPLSYQWYYNGTQAIAGATSATLTLTNVQAANEGTYFARVSNAGGSRDSLAATLTVLPLYNTAQMTNIWSVLAGTRPYLNTFYYEYGMCFNPVNSNLLVASYVATNPTPVIIAVLDALTGAHKHVLDVSVVYGGNRWINKIGVANDGVVYAGNRSTAPATDPFILYRWADDAPTTIASIAFSGDPAPSLPTKVAGYTMDVRGAGVNTEILMSFNTSNVVSLLTTPDGVNFVPTEIFVAGAPDRFARLGICFGAGNTFWAKSWATDPGAGKLFLVQYDANAGTGTILRTYDTDKVSSTMTTVAYNDSLKLLAGIARDDQKNVQIYSVADLDLGPVLRDQELFPTYNPSIEANGALDFGGNTYLFAMNENNGIMAFLIDSSYQPPAAAFSIVNVTTAGGSVTLTWQAQNGKSYQVQAVGDLGGTWQNLGSPVTATGSTASYTDNSPGNRRFYRVLAQ
ncbi:MAG TPA: immunoglobulin domain-containing protein, partial [Candidatus Paceibacterota bacterium]|nr:immunoglobulin domain-containing protein [Candidatus Paceibacterota bacterium]